MVGKRLLLGRKKMAGNVRLEAHIRTETLDVVGGERPALRCGRTVDDDFGDVTHDKKRKRLG